MDDISILPGIEEEEDMVLLEDMSILFEVSISGWLV